MAIKLDMGKAWNDAVALLSANKDVVLIVAAVFFFLPNAIASLTIPQPTELEAMTAAGGQPDMDALVEVLTAYWSSVWWVFALLAVVQAIGMLGLLALLRDSSRPTVGQALSFGVKALLPYIACQLLATLLMVIVVGVLVGIGALIAPAVAALLGLVGMVFAVYIYVKFSLLSPVIGIEGRFNPISALQRSWQLTKGNSLRLFAFYLMLIVVFMVLSIVASMFLALFSIMGEELGLFASAIGGALITMVVTSIMLAVLASVHQQLSGGSGVTARATFE